MKKFKIYGYSNNNPILITNSDNISPASTFEENLSAQQNSKYSLSFKISDTLPDGKSNLFLDLLYPKAKVRLELNTLTETILADQQNNYFVFPNNVLKNNQKITFLTTGIASGFYAGIEYYITNANQYTFQIAETYNGSPITITGSTSPVVIDYNYEKIDFVINSVSTEFNEEINIYSFEAEDYASVDYAKLGVGLSLVDGFSGTIKEILQEVLAQSRVNSNYINASYNYIDFLDYKNIINGKASGTGTFSSYDLKINNSLSLTFYRDLTLNSLETYKLEFNISSLTADTNYTIKQFNLFGIEIQNYSISNEIIYIEDQPNYLIIENFIPAETMNYFTITFSNDLLVGAEFICSDFKINKILNQNLVKQYINIDDSFIDDYEDFKSTTSSYSYYKKATLQLDNSNLYNALIEIGNLFDAYLFINYNNPNTITFKNKNNSVFNGYRLSPHFNLLSISRSEDSSEFATTLNVKGSEDVVSIYPSIPNEFFIYFQECIDNNFDLPEYFELYGTGIDEMTYQDKADELSILYPDKKADFDAFAYACDKVPNFENTIYNIDYFYRLGKISTSSYEAFQDLINNGLRKINIKLRVYSELYNKTLIAVDEVENEVSFNANNITVEELFIEDLNNNLTKVQEYNDLDVKIVGDNLLKNSNFGVYGQEEFGDYAYQYQIPTGWTLSDVNYKKFQVNRDILSQSENTTVKFQDLEDPGLDSSYQLYLDENDMADLNGFSISEGFYSSPFTISSDVYITTEFNLSNYKPYISLRYKTLSGSTFSYVEVGKVSIPISPNKGEWITLTSVIPSGIIPYSAISMSIVLGVERIGSYSNLNSICYFGDPQLEPRSFKTAWNNDQVAAAETIGLNMIPNSDFIGYDVNYNPVNWTFLDSSTFRVGVDIAYQNNKNNYLEFFHNNNLKLKSYIATQYIDLDKFELGNRFVTFSFYVYRGSSDTLKIPMYFSIGTYTDNKLSQGTDSPNQEYGFKTISLEDISQIGSWIRVSTTTYIPNKNRYGNIKYIRGLIGYNKIDSTIIGLSTDKLRFSLPQMELRSSATDWTPVYDPDGIRYATYKFTKKGNELDNDDLVYLEFNEDLVGGYNSNKNLYPAPEGIYYIISSTGESFKLSTSKGGSPITYNNMYDITSKNNWKIRSYAVQENTDNWINLNNQIYDREKTILNYRVNIMKTLDIIYDIYSEPVSLYLENNKLAANTYLYNLFSLYGYYGIYKNGLQTKINSIKKLIEKEYNEYQSNVAAINNLIILLDNVFLTDRERILLESEKEGFINNNNIKKFNIGSFRKEEPLIINNQKVLGFISTIDNEQPVSRFIDVTEIVNKFLIDSITNTHVMIYSVDGSEKYLRKIIDYDSVNKLLHIEYFYQKPKEYNYYLVDVTENIEDLYINGKYHNELFYYNILNIFMSSYVYKQGLIDYSVWGNRYDSFNYDITARIIGETLWDYTGEAYITKYPYGELNDLDYMVKILPNTTLWTNIEIETEGEYEFKLLYKAITENTFIPNIDGLSIQILNSNNQEIYLEQIDILNQTWNLFKTASSTSVNLVAGSYTVKFINSTDIENNITIILYKPAVSLKISELSDSYLTDEEIISLRDNPQLLNYQNFSNIIVDNQVGFYDYIKNMNYEGNLNLIKYNFISDLYKNYKNFIYEGYYENSDESDSKGLLEQALLSSDKFSTPNIQYTTSVIDLSAIENYQFLDIKVNDKILIAEPSDRLYKSYKDEETKYLIISQIDYNLRDIGSTSITVSEDDEKDRILQNILKKLI